MGHTQEKPASGGMNISVKSFITAIAMLAALMVLTYVLTFFVPAGTFERTELDGQMAVLPGTYHAVEGGIPFWKWLLSPILVLFSEGNVTIIAILVFLFVIGGVFPVSYTHLFRTTARAINGAFTRCTIMRTPFRIILRASRIRCAALSLKTTARCTSG